MVGERYLVVKEEATFAPSQTLAPTDPDVKYIDIQGETLVYSKGVTPVETAYSRDIRKMVEGKALVSGGVDFAGVEPENMGWFFKWALGSVTSAVVSGSVYKHEFKPADTIKSFTSILAAVGQFPTDTYRRFEGCLINRLHLESVIGEILKASIDVLGAEEKKDSTFTPTDPLTISSLAPFVSKQATLTLASADKSSYLRRLTLDISNNIPVDDMYGHGATTLQRILVGRRTVDVELEMAFEDFTDYDKMLAGTEVAADLKFEGPIAEGSEKYEFYIKLPKMVYKEDTAPHIVSRDPLVVRMPCQVLYDSTSGYEVMLELHNLVTDYA